jgi:hypothetical protein
VKIVPWGPDQRAIEAISRAVARHASVKRVVKRGRHRLLSVELSETEVRTTPSRVPAPPRHYRATIYDYANNRTVLVDGRVDDLDRVDVSESGIQPLPSAEEFDAAVDILREDPELGPAIRERQLQAQLALPPPSTRNSPTAVRSGRSSPCWMREGPEIVASTSGGAIRLKAVRHPVPAAYVTCGPPALDRARRERPGRCASPSHKKAAFPGDLSPFARPLPRELTDSASSWLRRLQGKRVLHRAHVPIILNEV